MSTFGWVERQNSRQAAACSACALQPPWLNDSPRPEASGIYENCFAVSMQSGSHYHTPSRELMDHTHSTVLLVENGDNLEVRFLTASTGIHFLRVCIFVGARGGERNIATGPDHTKQRHTQTCTRLTTPPSSSGTRAASHEGAAGRGAGVSAREAEGVRSLARLAAVWCTRTDRVGRRTVGAGGCAWWPAAQCISTSVHVSSKYPKPAAV